jgi:hypothetical protein
MREGPTGTLPSHSRKQPRTSPAARAAATRTDDPGLVLILIASRTSARQGLGIRPKRDAPDNTRTIRRRRCRVLERVIGAIWIDLFVGEIRVMRSLHSRISP